jgi:hypothetical protein
VKYGKDSKPANEEATDAQETCEAKEEDNSTKQ